MSFRDGRLITGRTTTQPWIAPATHKMKVTILGATGLLGQVLMREWSGDEVIGFGVEDVDVRNAERSE